MSDSDDIFLKRFSLVIGVLFAITIAIIVIAVNSEPEITEDKNPSRTALAFERIEPVSAVRTEVTAEDLAASTPVAAAPVDPANIDGSAVYGSACVACHMSGVAGAPIPGSDDWAARAGQGLDVLSEHAINGFNTMPAKGGRIDLSDAEVIAAVEHMLAQ